MIPAMMKANARAASFDSPCPGFFRAVNNIKTAMRARTNMEMMMKTWYASMRRSTTRSPYAFGYGSIIREQAVCALRLERN
jgi:hypothetical protein